jgi:hypothetical protein
MGLAQEDVIPGRRAPGCRLTAACLLGGFLFGVGGAFAAGAAAGAPARAGSAWLEVGTGSASAGGVSDNATASAYVSLALGSGGRPILAWHDRSLQDVLVAAWNGAAWDRLGVGAAAPGGVDDFVSGYPSLAVLGDAPVLAWVQEPTRLAFALYVRRWDGSAWVELGTGSASGSGVSQTSGWALYPSLAATAGGRLVLAWQEFSGEDDEICVRQWTGNSWGEMGVGSAVGSGISHSPGRATHPAVATGAGGEVAVAWIDDASGASEVYLRLWDGTAWVELGAQSASGGGISASHGHVTGQEPPAVAITPAGQLIVAWADAAGGNAEIYVRRWDGAQWAEMGTGSASGGGVSATAGASTRPALALTAAGTPLLAWQEQASGSTQILVRRWSGLGWVDAGGGGAGDGVSQTAGASRQPALAVDVLSQDVFVAWDCNTGGSNTDIYARQWAGAASLDPPRPSLGTATVVAGADEATLRVTYADEGDLDLATLDGGDLEVAGPHGYQALARLVSASRVERGGRGAVEAIYALAAPGGSWEATDNGVYAVTLLAGAVADAAGNWIEMTALGTFAVSVPPPVVLWRLTVSGEDTQELEFGMADGAAEGLDGLDAQADPDTALAWFEIPGYLLRRDHRPVGDGAAWRLTVVAEAVDLTMAWAGLSGIPVGRYLSIYELTDSGLPLGNSACDMAAAGGFTIAAGESRAYVIRYAADLVIDIALRPGWNMLSLPLAPVDGRVSSLAAAVVGDPGAPGRDGAVAAALGHGVAWTLAPGGQQHPVIELQALTGYWLYAPAALVLLVRGTPLDQPVWELQVGWNLVGPPADRLPPHDAALAAPVWEWQHEVRAYRPAALLRRTSGFWIFATAPLTLDLGAPDKGL